MTKYHKVDITTLQGGAVIERINHEIARIFANIADLNTDPKAGRELQLKIKFIPTEDRASAGVSMTCSSKLVSGEALKGRIYLQNGEAFESQPPVAGSLFDEFPVQDEVIEIANKRRKNA